MALFLKAAIGAIAVVIIDLLSRTKNYYVAALVPLFPTFSLIAYYIIGVGRTVPELKTAIRFGGFALIPYLLFEPALFYYRRCLREYPKGAHVKEVEARIAELDHRRAKGIYEVALYYERRRQYRAALIYYEDLMTRFPLSPYAEEAQGRVEAVKKRAGSEPKAAKSRDELDEIPESDEANE